MTPTSLSPTRTRLGVIILSLWLSPTAAAQVINVFNNGDSTWTNAGAWTPSGPPGPANTAQFGTLGTTSGVINQPVLSSSTSITQLAFSNTAYGGSWSLSGTGALTAGSASAPGVSSRGVGNYTLNLGDGAATSLTLTGSSGTTVGGAINVGHGSGVTLTGNTVASLTTISNIALRGGTLVLDNSAGNPAGQRLTGAGTINTLGGGSALEFRSAPAGSNFTGLTGALTLGGGDGAIRVNQTGSGQLNVTLGSLTRDQTEATVNFLNVGNGTLGGGGAGDPTVKFTTAPGLTNGVIAFTAGGPAVGWAVYNGTDFAGYDATNGVIPVPSTAVSGALTTASSQNSRLVGNATLSGTVAYNSLKISPSAAGQSLAISAGGTLSTLALLLAGPTDYTITGGTIGNTGSPRYFHVTDPNASLFVSSNLAVNQAINKSGDGFLVLTGTTNQVAFTSTQNFNLTGGTLRVTSTNFSLTTANAPTLRFRGGVIEYDVSGGAFTFNRLLGTGAGQLNWNQGAGSNNVGSGGFSAFSSNSANALTVSLGAAALTWGGTTGADANFVQDGHALLFGSTKSNATVNWQNPLNLDSGTAGAYQAREISVTRGVGNAEDKTKLNGVIAGSATTDLFKTGTGYLELTAANTYAGNTQVARGTLLVTGSVVPNTGSSNVFVHPAGTLGGAGTLGSAGNNVNVFAAGTVNPGTTTGTLTVNGNLTFTSTGTYAVELGGTTTGTYDQATVNGSVALNNASLTIALVNGYTPANSDKLFLAVNDAADAVAGTFNNIGQDATITFGGYSAQLSYTGDFGTGAVAGGNDIVLYNFTAVPELGSYALVGLTALGLGAARHLRKTPGAAPAASVS